MVACSSHGHNICMTWTNENIGDSNSTSSSSTDISLKIAQSLEDV